MPAFHVQVIQRISGSVGWGRRGWGRLPTIGPSFPSNQKRVFLWDNLLLLDQYITYGCVLLTFGLTSLVIFVKPKIEPFRWCIRPLLPLTQSPYFYSHTDGGKTLTFFNYDYKGDFQTVTFEGPEIRKMFYGSFHKVSSGNRKKCTLNKGLGVFQVLKSSFMWSTVAKINVFCIFRIIYQTGLSVLAILN